MAVEHKIMSAFALLAYFFSVGGDFSFFLALASLSKLLGFLDWFFQLYKQPEKVSSQSLLDFAIIYLVRLVAIVRHEGYLVHDKSGDWLYHFIDVFSLGLILGSLPRAATPIWSQMKQFLGPFLVLLVVHPQLQGDVASDVAWASAELHEAFALIPQLQLICEAPLGTPVVELVADGMASIIVGRLMELLYWQLSFVELSHVIGSGVPIAYASLCQILQFGLLWKFISAYWVAKRDNVPVVVR